MKKYISMVLFLLLAFSFSDSTFANQEWDGDIEILSPMGGEVYAIGEEIEIKWSQRNINSNLFIGYYDNHDIYGHIDTSYPDAKEGINVYKWTPPDYFKGISFKITINGFVSENLNSKKETESQNFAEIAHDLDYYPSIISAQFAKDYSSINVDLDENIYSDTYIIEQNIQGGKNWSLTDGNVEYLGKTLIKPLELHYEFYYGNKKVDISKLKAYDFKQIISSLDKQKTYNMKLSMCLQERIDTANIDKNYCGKVYSTNLKIPQQNKTSDNLNSNTFKDGNKINQIFIDVDDSTQYQEAILYLSKNKIVNGYSDGSFKPNAKINRAEFSKIIVEALYNDTEIESCNLNSMNFNDVPLNSWYAKYACKAKKENLLTGYPDGRFGGENYINFVEAAKILLNAFRYQTKEYFVDPMEIQTSINAPWYESYVIELELLRVIPADINTFNSRITRGQMAEMIQRLREHISDRSYKSYRDIR